MIHTKYLLIALGIAVLGMVGFGAYVTFGVADDVAAHTEAIFVSNVAAVSEVVVEVPQRPGNIWDSLMPQLEKWYQNRPPEPPKPEVVIAPPSSAQSDTQHAPIVETQYDIPDWVENPAIYEQAMQYTQNQTSNLPVGEAASETTSTSTRSTATTTIEE